MRQCYFPLVPSNICASPPSGIINTTSMSRAFIWFRSDRKIETKSRSNGYAAIFREPLVNLCGLEARNRGCLSSSNAISSVLNTQRDTRRCARLHRAQSSAVRRNTQGHCTVQADRLKVVHVATYT